MSKKEKITNAVELREARRKAAKKKHDLPIDEVLELEYEERVNGLPNDDEHERPVRWDQLFDED